MKRKFLLVFISVLTAVCMCISASACDFLLGSDDSSDSSQSSSQSLSGSSSEQEQSTAGSSSGQSSSGGSSSSGSTEQSSSDGSSSDSESGDGTEVVVEYSLKDGNSSYGYNQFGYQTNGANMQSFYYQMYTACEEFAESTEDVEATTFTSGSYYVISRISYSGYSMTTSEAVSVWEIFHIENPMYYWLSTTCVYSDSASILFLCIDGLYAGYTDRAEYDEDISSMAEEACTLVAQKSTELEKVMAIHDYIIDEIDYAYQSDGETPETANWAHSITGVSSYGYGVCEAYSKTFLALCLINGIDCIIATGTVNSEAHAWNLVEIDGAWYGVDCTWDDKGSDAISYTYFGMNASALSSTRTTATTSGNGTNYLYDLPEVSSYSIQIVTLFEGTDEMGMYSNIDAAFNAMTDSTADYTIELYYYNSTGEQVYTSSSGTPCIYSDSTPAVNSITINGIYTSVTAGTFTVTSLSMQNKLTLNCNLTVSNVTLTATELDLGDYTLTTSGNFCKLDGTIYDSKTTTDVISINSATTNQTRICGTVNVGYVYGSDILDIYGGTVTIGIFVTATDASYHYIYLRNKGSLSVSSIEDENGSGSQTIYIFISFDSSDEYPALYMGSVQTQVQLLINGTVSTVTATPDNLSCALATLGNAEDFENIKIYFYSAHGYSDKTSYYSVNASNEIVLRS